MRYLILIFLIVSCGGGGKSSIQNTPDITSEPVVRTDNFEEVNNIRSYGKASSLLETRMIAPGALKGLAAPEKVYQKNDKRYQIAYTEIKKNLSNLNHIDFKEGLRNIKIVGIDIEFSKDKELFIMLNQAKDIAQLEIHADIITISDPLFIPSTQLVIYANKIIFKKEGKFIMTPSDHLFPAETRENGLAGLDAPNAWVYANEVIADSNQARFIMTGGKGQNGGKGIDGRPGERLSVPTNFKDGDIIYRCSITTPHVVSPGNPGYVILKNSPTKKCSGIEAKPNNGFDAIAGGFPGVPGKSGKLYSNLITLESITDSGAGRVGDKAPTAKGGAVGFPKVVKFLTAYYPEGHLSEQVYEGKDGLDAVGPELDYDKETFKGNFITVTSDSANDFVNESNDMKLKYIQDHYRANRYVESLMLATEMADELDRDQGLKFSNKDKNYLKLQEIISKIYANKNFYGDDAFSIPFLSLDMAVELYRHQIDYYLNTIYFSRWVQSENNDLVTRREEIARKREEFSEEIEKNLRENDALIKSFDEINRDAVLIERDTQGFLKYLQILEIEIQQSAVDEINRREAARRRANGLGSFKGIIKTLSSLAKVVPVGQPVLATAVSSAEVLIETFKSDSWEDRFKAASTLYKNTKKINFSEMSDEWNQKWEPFRMSNLETLSTKEKAKRLGELGKLVSPVIKEMKKELSSWQERRAPQNELEAVVEEIRNNHPEFNKAVKLLSDLNEKKVKLDSKINETFIRMSQKQSDILDKTTILAGLTLDGEESLATLSLEEVSAIQAMEERVTLDLSRYHDYFSRVYFFSTLKQQKENVDLFSLYNSIDRLLLTTNETPRNVNLAPLKVIFLEKIENTIRALLDGGVLVDEATSRVVVELKGEELKNLMKGENVFFNLKEMEIFGEHQKNARIKNIQILEVETNHKIDGLRGNLYIEHSGHSIFEKNGEKYLFTHFAQDSHNPFFWGKSLDFSNPLNDRTIERSGSYESLLQTLIQGGQSRAAEYVFPSALSDLILTLKLNRTDLSTLVKIEEIKLEIEYIYNR